MTKCCRVFFSGLMWFANESSIQFQLIMSSPSSTHKQKPRTHTHTHFPHPFVLAANVPASLFAKVRGAQITCHRICTTTKPTTYTWISVCRRRRRHQQNTNSSSSISSSTAAHNKSCRATGITSGTASEQTQTPRLLHHLVCVVLSRQPPPAARPNATQCRPWPGTMRCLRCS